MAITRRQLTLGGSALGASGAVIGASGCSPLQLLDTIGGREAGSAKAATGLPYGPHPRQALDVHVPVRPNGISGSALAPVAVFFYGGSWTSGSRADYEFAGAALAGQGFVAIVPDYRLYPEVKFPAFLDDSAAAIRWARDNAGRYGGDGRRIVLVGHSAGAYIAAMLALDPTYLRRAGVSPEHVRAFAGLSGPYDFLPLDPGVAQNVFGDAPNKAATQPVGFVRRGAPAAFLATGDRDRTVRPANTASLAAKLRSAGVPVVERIYSGLNHADTLLALTVLLRGKAPVLQDMAALLRRRSDLTEATSAPG